MESPVRAFMPQNISMKVQPFSRESIISFKDPRQLWTENWFALVLEVLSAVILLQVFRNAKKNGPQSAYIILAAITAAISFEVLPIVPRPGYQLWWYHQGTVNILKQRVPSYVITVYALVHYMAHNLTNRSNLPMLTRSVVTAICGTLIMFPCLWLAPRLLLLLLHFDDAVFRDQIASVPYIQILVMFLLFFHTSHLFQQNFVEIEPQEKNTYSFVKCAIHSGIVSAMYAIVEQYLLYILFNLILKGHTILCLIGGISVLFYLARDEIKQMQMTSYSVQGIIHPLLRREFWIVVAAMFFTSTLPLWLNTHNLKSASDRLELGPCHIMHEVSNTSPLELPRRRYVCPDDGSHLNFDFHCVAKKDVNLGVKNRTKHYTVCGKSFENPHEIAKNFGMYSVTCIFLFYAIMLFSFTFKVQVQPQADCKKVD